MALTPEDVVNKRFQPTKFREGYDQDEVDDFLDEIVVELRRLNQENEELRRQVAAGTATAGSTTSTPSGDVSQAAMVPGPVSASTSTQAVTKTEAGTDPQSGADAEAATGTGTGEVAAETQAPSEQAASGAPTSSTTSVESAAGVLAMAQRLHDEYVNAGVEQRDKIIAEAQIEANGLVTDAEEKSRKTLGDLEQEKSVLERKVEQLRGFERDYRTRLKAYIEGQLRELDARGPIASDSATS